jgi:hypothetical protein
MSDEFGTATHDTIIAQARRMLARIGVEATDWGVHEIACHLASTLLTQVLIPFAEERYAGAPQFFERMVKMYVHGDDDALEKIDMLQSLTVFNSTNTIDHNDPRYIRTKADLDSVVSAMLHKLEQDPGLPE